MTPAQKGVELSLLASLIMSKEAQQEMGYIKPEFFGMENHRLLFEVMRSMQDRKEAIDMTTVSARFKDSHPEGSISEVINHAVKLRNPENFQTYARVAQEHATSD